MKINSLQVEIDGIDKEILRDLMDDARKPILQIANKIGKASSIDFNSSIMFTNFF
jgi:polyribonucleotide nucleotidyltransferase